MGSRAAADDDDDDLQELAVGPYLETLHSTLPEHSLFLNIHFNTVKPAQNGIARNWISFSIAGRFLSIQVLGEWIIWTVKVFR
jgi:hypothetical protein